MTTSDDGIAGRIGIAAPSDLGERARDHFATIVHALEPKGLARPQYRHLVAILAQHLADIERHAIAQALHGETYSPGPAMARRTRPEELILKRSGKDARAAMRALALKPEELLAAARARAAPPSPDL